MTSFPSPAISSIVRNTQKIGCRVSTSMGPSSLRALGYWYAAPKTVVPRDVILPIEPSAATHRDAHFARTRHVEVLERLDALGLLARRGAAVWHRRARRGEGNCIPSRSLADGRRLAYQGSTVGAEFVDPIPGKIPGKHVASSRTRGVNTPFTAPCEGALRILILPFSLGR